MSLFDNKTDSKESYDISRVKPWIRFGARITDVFLFRMIIGIIQLIIFPDRVFDETLINLGSLLIWVSIESHLLYTWGTTPGKWLFKTRVKALDSKNIDVAMALKRSFVVWALGMGVGIFNYITFFIGYLELKRKGIAPWDRISGCIVVHDKISENRLLGVILIILGLLTANAVLFYFNNTYLIEALQESHSTQSISELVQLKLNFEA